MFESHKLPNGIQSIISNNPNTQAVTILVMFGVGSRYENDKQGGLSHYLEHLFFKGTKNRPNTAVLARELDGLGASYNAFTGEEYTGYYIEIEKDKLSEAIEIMADLLQNPLFEVEELKREKQVIIEEINMYEDLPQRDVVELAKSSFYGDTSLGRNIAGTRELVQSFTKDDVVNYKNGHYHSANMRIIVCGNVETRSAKAQIQKHFGQIKTSGELKFPKAHFVHTKPALKLKFKQTDQAHLVLGLPGVSDQDPDRVALDLVSVILGGGMSSRLFIEVRERRGLGYYVRNNSEHFHDGGMFFAHAGVKTNRIEEALETILEEYRKIQNSSVDAEELQKAKNQIKGRLAVELEQSQNLAMFYGEQSIYAKEIQDPKQVLDKVEAVNLDQIKTVIDRIIKPELINLSIVGPYKDPSKFEKLINSKE